MALQCSNCCRSHISTLGAVADGRNVFCNVDCAWSYRFRLAAAIATQKAAASAATAAAARQAAVAAKARREPVDAEADRRRVAMAGRAVVASAASEAVYVMHHMPAVDCGNKLLN
ncbi:hypothetical protein MMPV_000503 [Pyropia vietnamensis]